MEMCCWLGGENDGNVVVMVVVVMGEKKYIGDCGGGWKSIKMWY